MSANKYEPTFLQNTLDSMGEGVMVLDKEFKVTKINKSAEKITGYKKKRYYQIHASF